jgi:hypothetical protein
MLPSSRQVKILVVEVLLCLGLAYILTACPFRYERFSLPAPGGFLPLEWSALSLVGLSLLPLAWSLRILLRLGRQRTGASDRFERRLSVVSFKILVVASVTLYFVTDLWKNVLGAFLSATHPFDPLVDYPSDVELMIFALGFFWLLLPFHFMRPISFIDSFGRPIRLDERRYRQLRRIAYSHPMAVWELLTPYPECAEVEPKAIGGPLGGIKGLASLELIGCRDAVSVLSCSKKNHANDMLRALSTIYESLRTCRFSPHRAMTPTIGQYVAAAHAIFSDNEFCSLEDFEKCNDVLSRVANSLATLHKGCGGHLQIVIRRKSYDSIVSRVIRGMRVRSVDGQPARLPSELRPIAHEIERKVSLPSFGVGINVLAWAPSPRLAMATLDAICQAVAVQGKYGFLMMKRTDAYDMSRHVYARKSYCELPFSNRELENLVHVPVRPCRGMRIVRSSPRGAGRPASDEESVRIGWELS